MTGISKPVLLTGLLTALLCLAHFVGSVYVSSHAEQRSFTVPSLAVPSEGLPYQVQALQGAIAQWHIPLNETTEQTEQTNAALAGYDKTTLGDITVSLLAIYHKQQPIAVLALQQAGERVSYVRLAAGDSSNDIQLSQINARNITLSYHDKQVKLQLFTPASAVTE